MRRKALFVVLMVLGTGAIASAQGWGRQGYPVTAEKVTVSGSLTIAQGAIAVKDGTTTYLVPGLGRFVGFIDTLKDGARVSLEGSAAANPQDANTKMLWVTKLTVGGKDYDLSPPQGTTSSWSAAPMAPRMQGRMR